MTRYFEAECDDEGQVIEENICEIHSPYHHAGMSFAVGILIGVLVTVIVL